MYSKEKSTALAVFHQTNFVSETIHILGYPTKKQLYTWIATENMVKRERKQLPRFANPLEYPRIPPLDVKLDIGYSRTSIYQWKKRFFKEGTLGFMNHKKIPLQKLDQNIS